MRHLLNRVDPRLSGEYESVLRDYLNGTGEAALTRAYEFGRRAVAEGLGVLDMASLHHDALLSLSPPPFTPDEWLKASEKLFVESMTPFEMTHRGFREAYAALRVSEERYRELLENANDVVFTTDLDGNLTSINRAGERLSGYQRDEVLSTNLAAIVAQGSRKVARRARERKLSGDEEGTKYELDILTKDGRSVPVEVNTRLIYQEGVPVGLQGIARDITERKHAEQALRQLNERLEEEARRIAHALHDEAGQMLTSVYLAVAEISSDLPPAARGRLEEISGLLDQVGEQMRHLSHELRPLILDDFGLKAALTFLARGVSQRAGLDITVESSMESRLPPLVETTVYRIVQEALTNVSKHAQAKRVHINLERDDESISGSIRDDGIGLDEAARSPQTGSRGLGLIGIRERLKGVGGTLSITSVRRQGTTLEIRIPVEG